MPERLFTISDIGGNFDGHTSVVFSFEDETITPEMQSDIAVRLAFSTDVQASSFQVLLFMQFREEKYMLIGISNDNSLFVEEKIYESVIRRKVVTTTSWSDNSRHWFYFTWKSEITTLIVDGKSYNPFIQVMNDIPESFVGTSNVLYIAGFPKHIKMDFVKFKGCISNVMIEFGELKLMPLETTFGYQKGSLEKVIVDGSVNERKCAAFTQFPPLLATLPSNIPPEIQGPDWFPEPPVTALYKSVFADMASTPLESISRASSRVAAVMGVLLIIVILALLFYIYRIQRRHKRERLGDEYHIYKKGKRRTVSGDRSAKAVSFCQEDERIGDDFTFDVQPLVHMPTTPPPKYTPSVNFRKPPKPDSNGTQLNPENSIELAPLRSTSSQELEWDPAGAQLVSTAMDDMNPDEVAEEDGPLPELKNQFAPLASVSEVTINRLSQTFT